MNVSPLNPLKRLKTKFIFKIPAKAIKKKNLLKFDTVEHVAEFFLSAQRHHSRFLFVHFVSLYNFYRIHNILSKLIASERKSGIFILFLFTLATSKRFFCQKIFSPSLANFLLKIAQWNESLSLDALCLMLIT